MGDRICRPLRVLKGVSVIDGAGVRLNRIVGTPQLDNVDPFVLLDEFKSENPDDYIAGFPTHPHRGIETITYMIHGVFHHKDSKGNGGTLTPGTGRWMTAGRGILHSEMPGQKDGLLWGYQLWLSLRAKDKMIPPRYQHLSADMIPIVETDGVSVKVISGGYQGYEGPAKNWVPATYLDVRLGSNDIIDHSMEEGLSKFIYIHTGSIVIDPDGDDSKLAKGEMAVLDEGTRLLAKGVDSENGFLFFAGVPNNEPIARGGPFVMNTMDEIYQAFEDYRNGKIQT